METITKYSLTKFERIIFSFNVDDIAKTEYRERNYNDVIKDFHNEDIESSTPYIIVRNNKGSIVGYCDEKFNPIEYEEENLNYKDVCRPIPINQIISDETNLIDAINLFEDTGDYFFILGKNNVSKILSFNDFDCLEIKICLFALTAEIEHLMIEILKKIKLDFNIKIKGIISFKKKSTDKAWENATNDNAIKRCLVFNTNLEEKFEIVSSQYPNILGQPTTDFFTKTIKKVRNAISHGESIISPVSVKNAPNDIDLSILDPFEEPKYILKDVEVLKNFIIAAKEQIELLKTLEAELS